MPKCQNSNATFWVIFKKCGIGMTIKNETFLMIFKLYEETYYLQRPRGACPRSNAMPDTWVRIFIAYWHERLKELKGTLECFFKVKQLRFVLRDASRPSSWQHQRSDAVSIFLGSTCTWNSSTSSAARSLAPTKYYVLNCRVRSLLRPNDQRRHCWCKIFITK